MTREELIARIEELKNLVIEYDNKAFYFRCQVRDKQEEVDKWKERYWQGLAPRVLPPGSCP